MNDDKGKRDNTCPSRWVGYCINNNNIDLSCFGPFSVFHVKTVCYIGLRNTEYSEPSSSKLCLYGIIELLLRYSHWESSKNCNCGLVITKLICKKCIFSRDIRYEIQLLQAWCVISIHNMNLLNKNSLYCQWEKVKTLLARQ